MFVCTRKKDEAIYIRHPLLNEIRVVICRVHDGQVRVGIDADKRIEIVRDDLDRKRKLDQGIPF